MEKWNNDTLAYSALKEIINIGGGNAATSLSKLIKQPVRMAVPTLELMDYEEVYQLILADDKEVKVVMMQLLDSEGSFLFVASPKAADTMAQYMYTHEVEMTEELAESAMKEMVNILVNSFLNAAMKVVPMNLMASVPVLIHDLFGSIFSSVYMEQGQFDSQIVIMHNEFWTKGEKIEGKLFFIPTPEFMNQLVKKLEIKR